MKLLKRILCAIIACTMVMSMGVFTMATGPVENQVVLLKFDDLCAENAHMFQRVADILKEEGITGSFGIMGYSLDADDIDDYIAQIKAWDAQGIEIWHHGYTSGEKEYLDTYENQYESFEKTQNLVKEKCGITMHSFCTPWGNDNEDTIRVLNEFPEITSLLICPGTNENLNAISFDITAPLESPTGNANYDSFIQNYRLKVTEPYIVVQSHPGMWDSDEDFEALKKTIAFLKEQGARFMTPTSYIDEYKDYLANPPAVDESKIYVRLNGDYIKFDVEPQLINDRTMVPFRAIFEKLGATVEWDEANNTASGKLGDTEIKLPIDSTTAYVNGQAVELDVPATVINDRTLVPIRFVSENFGAIVHWSEEENTVIIKTVKPGSKYELSEGQLAIAGSTWNKAFNDEIGPLSYDGDVDSVWSAEGFDVWVCYDLGEVKNVSEVKIMWNKGDARQAKFEVLISNDGENFTSVFDGLASGNATNEFESTAVNAEARYVKVLCKGNMVGETPGSWNAIKEIAFFGE